MVLISKTGFWATIPSHQRKHDAALAAALSEFFHGQTVIDFGCGDGYYVNVINESSSCRGYEGNPHTTEVGGPACHVLDLSQPVDVYAAGWVLSLEVGEHIPQQYEDTFIENLHRHNIKGIVLSWAWPGQGGSGHCNERTQEYVAERFESLGYHRDTEEEQAFRQVSRLSWFQTNILVLRRSRLLNSPFDVNNS